MVGAKRTALWNALRSAQSKQDVHSLMEMALHSCLHDLRYQHDLSSAEDILGFTSSVSHHLNPHAQAFSPQSSGRPKIRFGDAPYIDLPLTAPSGSAPTNSPTALESAVRDPALPNEEGPSALAESSTSLGSVNPSTPLRSANSPTALESVVRDPALPNEEGPSAPTSPSTLDRFLDSFSGYRHRIAVPKALQTPGGFSTKSTVDVPSLQAQSRDHGQTLEEALAEGEAYLHAASETPPSPTGSSAKSAVDVPSLQAQSRDHGQTLDEALAEGEAHLQAASKTPPSPTGSSASPVLDLYSLQTQSYDYGQDLHEFLAECEAHLHAASETPPSPTYSSASSVLDPSRPQAQSHMSIFDRMPVEIFCEVASYLNWQDLNALESTCMRDSSTFGRSTAFLRNAVTERFDLDHTWSYMRRGFTSLPTGQPRFEWTTHTPTRDGKEHKYEAIIVHVKKALWRPSELGAFTIFKAVKAVSGLKHLELHGEVLLNSWAISQLVKGIPGLQSLVVTNNSCTFVHDFLDLFTDDHYRHIRISFVPLTALEKRVSQGGIIGNLHEIEGHTPTMLAGVLTLHMPNIIKNQPQMMNSTSRFYQKMVAFMSVNRDRRAIESAIAGMSEAARSGPDQDTDDPYPYGKDWYYPATKYDIASMALVRAMTNGPINNDARALKMWDAAHGWMLGHYLPPSGFQAIRANLFAHDWIEWTSSLWEEQLRKSTSVERLAAMIEAEATEEDKPWVRRVFANQVQLDDDQTMKLASLKEFCPYSLCNKVCPHHERGECDLRRRCPNVACDDSECGLDHTTKLICTTALSGRLCADTQCTKEHDLKLAALVNALGRSHSLSDHGIKKVEEE